MSDHCTKDHSTTVLNAIAEAGISKSQKMQSRHLCAACAYEAGYEAAKMKLVSHLKGPAVEKFVAVDSAVDPACRAASEAELQVMGADFMELRDAFFALRTYVGVLGDRTQELEGKSMHGENLECIIVNRLNKIEEGFREALAKGWCK